MSFKETGFINIPNEIIVDTLARAIKYVSISNIVCQVFSEAAPAESELAQFLVDLFSQHVLYQKRITIEMCPTSDKLTDLLTRLNNFRRLN